MTDKKDINRDAIKQDLDDRRGGHISRQLGDKV